MSNTKTLEDQIRRLIVECLELNIEASEFELNADLKEDVGLDSAALLELVSGIEERFGFEVDVEEVTEQNFRNLAGLVAYVRERTNAA
jgi:acyl carrier protein